MERHFQQELEGVKTTLIKMGSVVEENINNAIKAILERNEVLAKKVIESDERSQYTRNRNRQCDH